MDTNVLVRYLTQDDPVQTPRATELIESLTAEAPGFISQVVLVETVWVLEACYAAVDILLALKDEDSRIGTGAPPLPGVLVPASTGDILYPPQAYTTCPAAI